MKNFIELFFEYIANGIDFLKNRPNIIKGFLAFVVIAILIKVTFGFFASNKIETYVAMSRTDMANALKQIQSEIFMQNIPVYDGVTPLKYKNWGDFIMDIAKLDKKRWKPTENGIRAIMQLKNGLLECSGDYLYIDTKESKLIFAPSKISSDAPFCKALRESYKDKTDFEINLKVYSRTY